MKLEICDNVFHQKLHKKRKKIINTIIKVVVVVVVVVLVVLVVVIYDFTISSNKYSESDKTRSSQNRRYECF